VNEKTYYTLTDDFTIMEVKLIEQKFFGIKRYIIKYPDGKIVKTFSNPINLTIFKTEKQIINSFLKIFDQKLRELCEFRKEQEIKLIETENMILCLQDAIRLFETKITRKET